MTRQGKLIAGSGQAYDQLKVITDAAQEGILKPWSPKVVELLNSYGITVQRKEGIPAEVTLSFPTSTKNKSMGIGVRHLKPDKSWAEDFFLFEEGVGLTSFYKGAQEDVLPEYKGTHHGQPTIELQESLPSIQKDIDDLKSLMLEKDIFNSIDMNIVVAEAEHLQALRFIDEEFKQTSMSLSSQGAPIQLVSMKIKPVFDKKRAEQMSRWSRSERLYSMKLEQIKEVYGEETEGSKLAIERLNRLFGKS